jgi:hypothetical protein
VFVRLALPSLHEGIRHQAVEADRRKQQRERPEKSMGKAV